MLSITFQPAADAITLVDDGAAALPLHRGKIESWPQEGIPQIEPGYGAKYQTIYPRGNIKGTLVFTDDCSWSPDNAGYAAAAAWHKAMKLLIDSQGTLIVTIATTIYTMAGAYLRQVIPVLINGVQLILRYTFEFTTMT